MYNEGMEDTPFWTKESPLGDAAYLVVVADDFMEGCYWGLAWKEDGVWRDEWGKAIESESRRVTHWHAFPWRAPPPPDGVFWA